MLATDPKETFDIVLETDKGRENPPTFVFRYLSAREFKELARKEPKEGEAISVDQELDRCFSAIRSNLVDWQNVHDREGKPVKLPPRLRTATSPQKKPPCATHDG